MILKKNSRVVRLLPHLIQLGAMLLITGILILGFFFVRQGLEHNTPLLHAQSILLTIDSSLLFNSSYRIGLLDRLKEQGVANIQPLTEAAQEESFEKRDLYYVYKKDHVMISFYAKHVEKVNQMRNSLWIFTFLGYITLCLTVFGGFFFLFYILPLRKFLAKLEKSLLQDLPVFPATSIFTPSQVVESVTLLFERLHIYNNSYHEEEKMIQDFENFINHAIQRLQTRTNDDVHELESLHKSTEIFQEPLEKSVRELQTDYTALMKIYEKISKLYTDMSEASPHPDYLAKDNLMQESLNLQREIELSVFNTSKNVKEVGKNIEQLSHLNKNCISLSHSLHRSTNQMAMQTMNAMVELPLNTVEGTKLQRILTEIQNSAQEAVRLTKEISDLSDEKDGNLTTVKNQYRDSLLYFGSTLDLFSSWHKKNVLLKEILVRSDEDWKQIQDSHKDERNQTTLIQSYMKPILSSLEELIERYEKILENQKKTQNKFAYIVENKDVITRISKEIHTETLLILRSLYGKIRSSLKSEDQNNQISEASVAEDFPPTSRAGSDFPKREIRNNV